MIPILLLTISLSVRSAHIDTKLNTLLHEEPKSCVSFEEISRDTPAEDPCLVSTTSSGDVYVLDSTKSYVLNTESMEFKVKDEDLNLNEDDVFTFFQDEAFAYVIVLRRTKKKRRHNNNNNNNNNRYGSTGLRQVGSDKNLISGSARAPAEEGNKLSALSDGRMILTGSEEIWMALPRDAGETRQWVRARGVEEGGATVRKGHSANVFVDDVRRGESVVVFGGCDEDDCTSDVKIFTARTEGTEEDSLEWSSVVSDDENGPSARQGHSAVIVNERTLVVYGGCNLDEECFDDVWELNLQSRTPSWRQVEFPEGLTKPSSGFVGVGTAVENGKVLSFGKGGTLSEFNTDALCPSEGICGEHGNFENGLCRCDYGFSGKLCDVEEAVEPCPNDCSNSGDCVEGSCRCNPGYARADCSFRCPSSCNSRGKCVMTDNSVGSCECEDSYFGAACEKALCPKACSGQGSCDEETGKCTCEDGFAGDGCELELSESCGVKCEEHGSCQEFEAGKFACACDEGWDGENCDFDARCPASDIVSNSCSGRGVCQSEKCVCEDGYEGELCEKKTCPGGDGETTCSGHGSCDFETGACACEEFFGHDDCSKEIRCEETQCVHGICVGVEECLCDEGFLGDGCELRECASNDEELVCSGHGSCNAETRICDCVRGYGDSACSTQCPNDGCGGDRGECVTNKMSDTASCICEQGFEGEGCEIERECENACNDNGVCSRGVCTCFPGFAGPACTEKYGCPNECGEDEGHGLCHYGKCICAPGRDGKGCERLVSKDEGDISSICDLDCMGRGVCIGSRCACKVGYAGDHCEEIVSPLKDLLPNCEDRCVHGECDLGRCSCDEGFRGSKCDIKVESQCPDACSGKGQCIQNVCVCYSGFTGDACSEPIEMDCNGHGVSSLGKCECFGSWTGVNCETLGKRCPQDCSRRGICMGGECKCLAGFGGEDCSQLTEASEICPDDCGIHGVCAEGQCFCDLGFSGPKCDRVVKKSCPNACSDVGYCDERKGICICNRGFTGNACEKPVECEDPTCSHRGVCKYGECTCIPGYGGKNCENTVEIENDDDDDGKKKRKIGCMNSCSGRGICHDSKCICEIGYTGDSCEITDIGAESCGRCEHGQCVLGRCLCDPGWESVACDRAQELPCPGGCNSHGQCHLGHCVCDLGYTGDACEKEAKNKCKHKCHGNGLCMEDKTCRCAPGFYGSTCEQVGVQPCVPTCDASHGRCVFGRCVCDEGFGSPDCSVDLAASRFKDSSVTVSSSEDEDEQIDCKCGPHGSCRRDGTCFCDLGYTGDLCELTKTCPKNCSSNGYCLDGHCVCDEPFRGDDCSLSAKCPQNCNNRGLCVEGRCYCALGFSSDSCIPIAEIAREMSSHVSPEPEQVMDPDTNRTFGTVGAIFVGVVVLGVAMLVTLKFVRRNRNSNNSSSVSSGVSEMQEIDGLNYNVR